MNRTIEIKKTTILNLLLSLIIGFGILFGLEHYGKFSYITPSEENSNSKPSFTSSVSRSTEVSTIYYDTFFGRKIETGGNGFTAGDLNYSNSEFGNYATKAFYYTEATKKDYMYGLLFSVVIFSIFLFSNNFKIKLL